MMKKKIDIDDIIEFGRLLDYKGTELQKYGARLTCGCSMWILIIIIILVLLAII
jgi:hypothetical protein